MSSEPIEPTIGSKIVAAEVAAAEGDLETAEAALEHALDCVIKERMRSEERHADH